MAWNYNAIKVGSSDLSTIRALIGDTSSGDQQVSDEIIRMFDSQEQNVWLAAAACCRQLASKHSSSVNKRVGSLWLDRSDKAKAYQGMARDYTRQGMLRVGARMGTAATLISAKDTEEADTDRVKPAFTRDMQSYPGTGVSSTS